MTTTPPTVLEIRELLDELHYSAEGGGGLDPSDCREAERIIRWLLNEYLRRGNHVCNDADRDADRVA